MKSQQASCQAHVLSLMNSARLQVLTERKFHATGRVCVVDHQGNTIPKCSERLLILVFPDTHRIY